MRRKQKRRPLTNADVPGFLGNLHLHVATETLGAFPAVPGAHHVEVAVRGEALVDGGDGGGGDGGGGRVGLASCAAGCGCNRVRLRFVLLDERR